MPSFDKLWMPAVRKSAGQTLFSTISAHGGLLKQPTWQAILWQVLFPLLDKVRSLSNSASSEKVDAGGNILIHHTRNTAQKQWAETQVLTLSGVARVFNTKRQLLQALGDFPRAWSILLEFIEHAALSKNNEVSIAALKSFQEILFLSKTQSVDNKVILEDKEIWAIAWKIWIKIGTEITIPAMESEVHDDFYLPSQTFLTSLVQIFPNVFQHIKANFTLDDLKQLSTVLSNAVSVPVYGETTPYIISASSDLSLTPLHDGVLHAVELLQKEAMQRNNSKMIPELFKLLLTFAKFTCSPPIFSKIENKQTKISDWVTMNYIPFGEKSVTMVVKLYEKTAELPDVINANILKEIIVALHTPLALKYNCVSNSVWKLAANSLITILKVGLKVARSQGNQFSSMWDELAKTLNDFLFPNTCASADKGLEEMVSDEATDCQIIELLRTEVLPYSKSIPKEFIMQVVILLNKGSIHSATNTLLQFSLIDGGNNELVINGDDKNNGIAGHLAVTSLLHRFQEVLKKYIEDEKLSIVFLKYLFVLKALTTLIISMKKAVKEDNKAWEQLISLYPYLVECTTTTSTQVSLAIKGGSSTVL
ncbi:hypothetical protein NQ318_006891 [Aromia moschata]|uniref:Mon2 C-terminal domain-containing protein n=1 Tax=Aromia moschata TaxID=1265417 RepID=A0AAV8YK42_9CUCU|nr:hypothetical protein NQ318_006891 [Aromia moschata]